MSVDYKGGTSGEINKQTGVTAAAVKKDGRGIITSSVPGGCVLMCVCVWKRGGGRDPK